MKLNSVNWVFPFIVAFLAFSPKIAESQTTIPASANAPWKTECVDKTLNLNGDFQSIKHFFWAEGQWSVGPAVSAQLIKYDLGKKRAGVNTALGAGASFRFYRPIKIKDNTGSVVDTVYIGEIQQKCRQTSFGGNTTSYLAAPMFSITPTFYVAQEVD